MGSKIPNPAPRPDQLWPEGVPHPTSPPPPRATVKAAVRGGTAMQAIHAAMPQSSHPGIQVVSARAEPAPRTFWQWITGRPAVWRVTVEFEADPAAPTPTTLESQQ